MTEVEIQAISFLKEKIWSHDEISMVQKSYRYEHSLRVAAIGRVISMAEGLDAETLSVGCILHDVGTFDSLENPREHGRISAKIAREFLNSIGYEEAKIQDICYGIAIHVDDKADFEGEKTTIAESISDCDNIDRFDVYRIYENLEYLKFSEMTIEDKLSHVNRILPRLKRYMEMKLATNAAKELWKDRVGFQIDFYERLKRQLESGSF